MVEKHVLNRYCCKVNEKLKSSSIKQKQIVHYTSQNQQKRANAAFLIASYAILYLKKSPKEAYKPLVAPNGHPLRPFQDAAMGISIYSIKLLGNNSAELFYSISDWSDSLQLTIVWNRFVKSL